MALPNVLNRSNTEATAKPFVVSRISDEQDLPWLTSFVSECLFGDPRWNYLVPDESKRLKVNAHPPPSYTPQVIRAVVKPTLKWMSKEGGNDIYVCVDTTTKALLGCSVWLPPGF